jgi:hypothetical protein
LYSFQRIWRHISTTPSGTAGGLYKMVGSHESGSAGFSLLSRFSFCGIPSPRRAALVLRCRSVGFARSSALRSSDAFVPT